jgi:hypothetical protein
LRSRSIFPPLEQVIEPAGAIPTISIRLERDSVRAAAFALAVRLGEEVDQPVFLDAHRDLDRLVGEVVQRDYRVVSPFIARRMTMRMVVLSMSDLETAGAARSECAGDATASSNPTFGAVDHHLRGTTALSRLRKTPIGFANMMRLVRAGKRA